jgi:hypothetical protein
MKKEPWQIKLIDLIEEEIVLATGVKPKKHHSGKCKMNEILDFVERQLNEIQSQKRTD